MSQTVELRGFDKVEAMLGRLTDLRPVKKALGAGAVHLCGELKRYPPATEANMPGAYPARWYQRGYGPRWALKGGGVHGRKTSETLGQKWTVRAKDDGLTWAVGNNASYAPHVQGADQAACHAAHGWKTVSQVAEEQRETVVGFVKEQIAKAIAGG